MQNGKDDSYVNILIPVYNNLDFTLKCITSILIDKQPIPYQITIIDNGSTDGTTEWVRKFQGDRAIYNEENLGWVKALNQGIKKTKGDFVVFLNNDVEVGSGWLQKLIGPLKHSDIGTCGPIGSNDHDWQYFGKVRKNFPQLDLPEFEDPKDVDGCNKILEEKYGNKFLKIHGMLAFFAVAFRRETIERVGLLDERFGVGLGDDDDYARRLEQKDLGLALALSCYVLHYSQTTFKQLYNDKELKALQARNYNLLKGKYPGRYK